MHLLHFDVDGIIRLGWLQVTGLFISYALIKYMLERYYDLSSHLKFLDPYDWGNCLRCMGLL